MTPDALAALTQRRPSFKPVRSSHPVWRWWVVLQFSDQAIGEKLCITEWGARRFGRRWVKRMEAVARSEQQ